jgi:hypothetical protein
MSSCVSAFICSVATEDNCQKKSSPQLKIMMNTAKRIRKFLDNFEEKLVREFEKITKISEQNHQEKQVETRKHLEKVLQGHEKNHQANQREMRKHMENIESSLRQFRRLVVRGESDDDSCPEDEKMPKTVEKDDFTPPELYRPIDFIQKYIMSDEEVREPIFALHYLEARFGDHYRGNRQGQCWRQKENGKYVECKFEDILGWIPTLRYQFQMCKTDPETYADKETDPEYFVRLNKSWGGKDRWELDRTSLKKFLHYKHKNLPSIRRSK